MHNTGECHNAVAGCVSGQLHSHESGSRMQEAMEVDVCHMKSEDSELFKQHFGSLSTACKVRRNTWAKCILY